LKGCGGPPLTCEVLVLLTVAIVLAILWALGFVVFKVTAGVIHLVLFIAVIALIAHFVRGRAPRA